jgi:hypothetical protein
MCLTLAACDGEPLEFAEWTIPVPEGTPIIEYAAVPMEERTERIELVEDLVIGRDDDPEFAFYQASDIAVDQVGRIYVLDAGNHRVQVFDSEGHYHATMGQEGEGPGEFQSPSAMAIAGDRLLVNENFTSRLSAWTLEGGLIESKQTDPPLRTGRMLGFPDGTLVSRGWDSTSEMPAGTSVAERLSRDGRGTHKYAEVPIAGDFYANRTYQGVPILIQIPLPELSIAADGREMLYVATCAEYEIHAFALDGRSLWALRTSWERQAIPEELFTSKVDQLKQRLPSLTRSDWDDPGDYPALEAIRVDGHGHLYVFPYVRSPSGDEVAERPVDVYTLDGEPLFSGTISGFWGAAHGDYVYTLRLNGETEEQEVVRYRLVEPF